ncbi:unnamed protein product [Choristocarpus tenellus]
MRIFFGIVIVIACPFLASAYLETRLWTHSQPGVRHRRSQVDERIDTALNSEREAAQTFRTEVHVKPTPLDRRFGYDDTFTLLGSCFSDNIGERLARLKYEVAVNPSHGILFSPLSVASSLKRACAGLPYGQEDLVFNKDTGLWCSLDHHSHFSSTNREACVEGINKALRGAQEDLLSSKCVFITLGSAWVFRNTETGRDVANCHKLPQALFEKRIVPVREIVSRLDEALSTLAECNPGCHVVITVSPVRHWRDGAACNMRSKAHLLSAAHELVELREGRAHGIRGTSKDIGNLEYFPSFEIVNDDLRDYRFFEADMIHPNNVAVNYILQKLMESMFSASAITTSKEVESLLRAKEHRPFNPHSEIHQQFLLRQVQKLDNLVLKNPGIDLQNERNHFSEALLTVYGQNLLEQGEDNTNSI